MSDDPLAPPLRVLTQNIRLARPETRPGQADHWPERAPVLQAILRREDADVVGTQEVLAAQIPVLDEVLAGTHERLGMGREGGSHGEHNLLYLRRDRLEILAWDQFWLSEQPRLIGSRGWDAHCERICVHARVRDRASGAELLLAVTHLDHAGQVAREQGAQLLAERLTAAADGAPILLMGDFNAAAGTDRAWQVLIEAGFADARDSAAEKTGADLGTFPDYGSAHEGGERIDWILTRGLDVESYTARLPEDGGRPASDHATLTASVRPGAGS